jgi:hypothetical protein
LSALSISSVKAARKIEALIKLWELQPGNDLLTERENNEAYLTSKPGEIYIVFFTNGGEAGLDLRNYKTPFTLKWMNIRTGEWDSELAAEGGNILPLRPPTELEWLAVVVKKSAN